jgi:hypothetical protein
VAGETPATRATSISEATIAPPYGKPLPES